MNAIEVQRYSPVPDHPWREPTLDIMRDFMSLEHSTPKQLTNLLCTDRFEYYGLQEGDTFVGFGSLNPGFTVYEHGYEIPYFGMTAENRCKGYGSFLLDCLEGFARERGQEYLYVYSTRPAASFYEKHGYEQRDMNYKYKLL